MAIGVGECAGVAVDLVLTLISEGEEKLTFSDENLELGNYSDSIYQAYAASINAAKALLLTAKAKTNSHASIIEGFDGHFAQFEASFGITFQDAINKINQNEPSEAFASAYIAQAKAITKWVKETREEQLK